MAKKAKKELTLEEKLQNALVADWEQPYAVPENWAWTRGEALFLPMESKKPTSEKFLYIDIDAINNKEQKITHPKTILKQNAPSRASRKINHGDTLFSLVRPYLKNIAYVSAEYSHAIASTGFYVCKPKKNLHPKYLFKLMCSDYVVTGLNAYMKGDNSPSIRAENITSFPLPLPPLVEQERIVQHIESLFAKLDTAKELLEEALESFESRKSALLHQAFTGELTKTWREKHDLNMESWEESNIKKVCKFIGGGTPSKAVEAYWNGKIPWASVKDVKGSFLYKTQDTITELGASNSATNIALENELLLITRISPGKPIITKIKTAINQDLKIVKTTLVTSYAFYLFLTLQEEIISKSSGSTVLGIRIEQLNQIMVNIPTHPEQEEIVRILDAQLQKEEKASAHIQHSLEHIEHMKKAILARAFRGELGTNNPEEASAVELLKEILEQKDNEPKKTRAIPTFKIPKEFKHQITTTLEKNIYKTIIKEQKVPLTRLLTLASNSLDIVKALNKMEKNNIISKTQDSIYSPRR